MSFQQFIEIIADPSAPLSDAPFHEASDPAPGDLAEFARVCAGLGEARRREVVSEMVEQAEENLELDFTAIFRLCLKDEDDRLTQLAVEGLWEQEDRWLVAELVALLRSERGPQARATAALGMTVWIERAASSEEPEALPKSAESLLLQSLGISERYHDVFIDEMLRCFGKDSPERLARHGSGAKTKVAIKSSVSEDAAASLKHDIAMSVNGGSVFRSSTPKTLPLAIANRAVRSYIQNSHLSMRYPDALTSRNHTEYYALGFLAGFINKEFISHLGHAVCYLPANRTGVMHARQVIVSSLISRASRSAQIRDAPLPALSGVIADFLESLIRLGELGSSPKTDSNHLKAADRIEKNILAGAVQIADSPTGYPEIHYRPVGWKDAMPLMSASSMVSELAPVVLYLRRLVKLGDTLIIEEPESHLHPAMQVEFMRQLAAVTLAGVRVILTTHSEWVLDELSNLTLLSQLPESRRDGIPGADFALDPKSVGVWLFRPNAEGSTVEEIPFGDEYGGYSENFSDVALDAYNSHAEIFNRIEEAKSE